MADRMTVHEFIEDEKLRLEAFKTFWLQSNIANPANYPIELDGPEWAEQLIFFDSSFNNLPE